MREVHKRKSTCKGTQASRVPNGYCSSAVKYQESSYVGSVRYLTARCAEAHRSLNRRYL